MKKKEDSNKVLQAVRSATKKQETASKAASKRQEKAIAKAAKTSSKEQVKAINAMSRSLKATFQEGMSSMANNQPQPVVVQPQSQKGLIISMIILIVVLIIGMFTFGTVILNRMSKPDTNFNQVTEERRILTDSFTVAQKELVTRMDSQQQELVKLFTKAQSELADKMDRKIDEVAKKQDATVQGQLELAQALLNLKEESRQKTADLSQQFGERINELKKGVEAQIIQVKQEQVIKVEAPKAPEPVVAAPVAQKASEEVPQVKAAAMMMSAPAPVASPSDETAEAKTPAPIESKKWTGSAKAEFKSNDVERDGTVHPGSAIAVDAKVFVTNHLDVEVKAVQGKDTLSKRTSLGVGYEIFPWLTAGLRAEKWQRDTRAVLSLGFNHEVVSFGKDGKWGQLSVLADVEAVKIFNAEVAANKIERKQGYEGSLGLNYSLSYLNWSTLSVGAGVVYNSGFNEVSRVSLFIPGKDYFYTQDKGKAANFSFQNEFKLGNHWTLTPRVEFIKTLGERHYLGDVITAGKLPKDTNVVFGVSAGYNW